MKLVFDLGYGKLIADHNSVVESVHDVLFKVFLETALGTRDQGQLLDNINELTHGIFSNFVQYLAIYLNKLGLPEQIFRRRWRGHALLVVCLYWLDIVRVIQAVAEKTGMSCIKPSRIYFLTQLQDLVRKCRLLLFELVRVGNNFLYNIFQELFDIRPLLFISN